MKKTTSERLKEYMNMTGLRQVDILEKCKPFCDEHEIRIGRNDLSQYVSGKVTPRQDKLSIIGMALDISEAWLMGYNVPMEREHIYTSKYAIVSSFGERIKEYRIDNNLTLEQMEQLTNIPAQTINRYELGQRVPKIDTAIDIAQKLQLNPLWLFGYDTDIEYHDLDTPLNLNEHEKNVLSEYRKQHDAQPFIDKLLGIEDEKYFSHPKKGLSNA